MSFFVLVVISSLYLTYGYGVNNYYDTKIEGRTRRIGFRKINLKKAFMILQGMFVFNSIISFLYSKVIFVAVVTGGTLALLYSMPPFRLKERLVSNLILNSLGFSFLFLIGFAANKPLTIDVWLLLIYIILMMVPPQVTHLLAHKEYGSAKIANVVNLFYFSLLLSTIWALFAWYCFSLTFSLFFITAIFSLLQVLLMAIHIASKRSFGIARRKLRYLNILLGLSLLLAFILKI